MSFSGKPASLDVSPLAQNVSDLEALASTVRKDVSHSLAFITMVPGKLLRPPTHIMKCCRLPRSTQKRR